MELIVIGNTAATRYRSNSVPSPKLFAKIISRIKPKLRLSNPMTEIKMDAPAIVDVNFCFIKYEWKCEDSLPSNRSKRQSSDEFFEVLNCFLQPFFSRYYWCPAQLFNCFSYIRLAYFWIVFR